MILRRLTANLLAQNRTAIGIEFLIVVFGVFIGTQVSNWNEERIEKREIGRLLEQMRPEIARLRGVTANTRQYYAVTDRFAHTALNGLNGHPKISDRDFVIAAYQASQVNGIASDANNFAQLMGGEQVRKIDHPKLRTAVMRLLNYDFVPVSFLSMQTRYRDGARALIPQSVQEKIRSQCSDYTSTSGLITLPPRCDADLSPAEASAAAAMLRAKPDMIGDLQLHQAAVASFLFHLSRLESRLLDLERLNR